MRPILFIQVRGQASQKHKRNDSQPRTVRQPERANSSTDLGLIEDASAIAPQRARNVHGLVVLLALRAGERHVVHVWGGTHRLIGEVETVSVPRQFVLVLLCAFRVQRGSEKPAFCLQRVKL
jgi:hypothetical protein